MANFTPQQIEEFLQEFFDTVGARQYVGARYVPIFGRAGEDTVEWDNLAPYEPLTVVMHEGVSYVSRRYVPRGIQITDTAYWVETYRFNAQVEQYRLQVLEFDGRIDDNADAISSLAALIPSTYFDASNTVRDYVDSTTDALGSALRSELVPYPTESSKYGEVGQVLSTAGVGETEWVDPVVPDAEDVADAVSTWLGDHPEATTTVTDGSVTDVKLASNGVKNIRNILQRILYNDVFYSVNHNYAFSGQYTLTGFYNDTGTWNSATAFRTALVPVPHAGTYQTYKSSTTFGSQRMSVQLVDANRTFIRNISAVVVNDQIIQITITDDDVRDASYVALSYRPSTDQMPMLYEGTYPTGMQFVEPIIQFSDNLNLRYMGNAPTNINSLKSGWWSGVHHDATGMPSGISQTNSYFLVSFANTFSNTLYVQFLLEPSNPRYGSTIRMRTINSNGGTVYDWTLVNGLLDYLPSMANKTLPPLNGNMFEPYVNETLDNCYMLLGTGEIVQANGYHLTYVPITGPGTYIAYVPPEDFGSNTYFPILNSEKSFLRPISANSLPVQGWYSYDVTATDIRNGCYTVVNWKGARPRGYMGFGNAVPTYHNSQMQVGNFDYSGEHLYKRVMVCDGDSICNAASDLPTFQNGWWGRTARAYSMAGANLGVGGGTITAGLYFQDQTPRHWLSRSIDAIHSSYPSLDYLILDGGTNDADLIGSILDPQSVPAAFGSWDADDFGGSYDDETFCGAVETLFYKALNYYPTAKVGFIIPMEMGTSTNTVKNRRAYFDEIAKIAEKWHIPVLDLWRASHLDARLTVYYDSSLTTQENINAGKAYQDGQHPTNVGYDLLQRQIVTFIKGL